MVYAYLRVSTETQEFGRQLSAVQDYVKENNLELLEENIFSDKITGKTFKRESYLRLKEKLQKDDCLIIQDIDRLGRNWDGIKQEWGELSSKGVYIIVINMPLISIMPNQEGKISTDKKLIQELMFTLLCYLSQKEVEKISERTKQALKMKKEQGIELGRKTVWNNENTQKLIKLYKDKKVMYKDLPKLLGVSNYAITIKIQELVSSGILEPRNKKTFGIKAGEGKPRVVNKDFQRKKLNEEQEQEMLVDYFENGFGYKAIREKYNIYPTSIKIIVDRAIASGQYEPKKKKSEV